MVHCDCFYYNVTNKSASFARLTVSALAFFVYIIAKFHVYIDFIHFSLRVVLLFNSLRYVAPCQSQLQSIEWLFFLDSRVSPISVVVLFLRGLRKDSFIVAILAMPLLLLQLLVDEEKSLSSLGKEKKETIQNNWQRPMNHQYNNLFGYFSFPPRRQ